MPWARAGAGAIATQALANLGYGPDGLDLLAQGRDAGSVVAALTAADAAREHRQLGVVDAAGRAASFTGRECFEWAGGIVGDGFCCQGNILAGPQVVDEMRRAFERAHGDLARRLLAAVSAGDGVGGDRRGRQSAALVVVREGGGYGGGIDRAVDLRVDDHPDPVRELGRLLELHRLYFPRPEDLEFVEIDGRLASELRALLARLGYFLPSDEAGPFDETLRDALYAYIGTENLEERWREEPAIEREVLEHLRRAAG